MLLLAVTASVAGVTRVQRIMLSGCGSAEAMLCGNIQLLPVALSGIDGVVPGALSSSSNHEQPVIAEEVTETVRKPPRRRKSRLFMMLDIRIVMDVGSQMIVVHGQDWLLVALVAMRVHIKGQSADGRHDS